MQSVRMFARLGALLLVLSSPAFGQATPKADFVFIVDATSSMGGEIAAVQSGLSGFVGGLDENEVDSRFAIVLFGGEPELVLDFTSDVVEVQAAFAAVSVTGAVPGFQIDHNQNPEASLEAIRIVLGASDEALDTTNVGGPGVLDFRSDARKNLIVVTDENSDEPFWRSNRFPDQVGRGIDDADPPIDCPDLHPAWQLEVDFVSDAVINSAAYVNLLVNSSAAPTPCQLGHPGSDVSDPNLLNFDAAATLANLNAAGYGQSLEAQVLAAGLVGRAFEITEVDSPDFIANFFAAKVEENNPFFYCVGTGCPCANEAAGPVAGCANSTGDGAALSHSGSLSVADDDLVLTATQVPAHSFGLIFFGAASVACTKWGDGLLGVQPGPPGTFMRLGVQDSGPNGILSSGPGIVNEAQSSYGVAGTILAGSTWYFQSYYRDALGGSPCGWRYNLSNALGVTFSN